MTVKASGLERGRERPGAGFLAVCVRLAGPWICYAIAPFVTFFYFLSGKSERRAVAELRQAVDGGSAFRNQVRAFANFVHFGWSMIDRLFAFGQGRVPPLALVRPFPEEKLARGAVLLGAHFGDWALCGTALPAQGFRGVHIVMDLSINPGFVSQVGDLSATQLSIIDASRGTIPLLLDVKCALENNGIVCFLADRGPRDGRTVTLPFFGRETRWHLGPFEIAHLFKRPLVAFFCVKDGVFPSSTYDVDLVELWNGHDDATPQSLARDYVAAFERRVRIGLTFTHSGLVWVDALCRSTRLRGIRFAPFSIRRPHLPKENAMTESAVTLPGLKAELKTLVVNVANLTHMSAEDIKDDEPLFRDGLGLDSIDLLEIAVHLEKRYGLKVQNDEGGRRALSNMENLARALHAHLTGLQATA